MAERRGTKALELWCRRMTEGYPGVKIDNMTTSWRDGLAFCAMIHHFRPDLIEFDKLNKADVYYNNELAFTTAEKYLGIPALLDADDMAAYEVPDRLSILTYLSQFYQAFAAQDSHNRLKRPSSSVTDKTQITKPAGPPSKMAHVVGVPRRDPCRKCQLPVFLAERLTVGKKVYHRTCLKCARCGSQLTPGSFYETEIDDQYCCETCPDEENEPKMIGQDTSGDSAAAGSVLLRSSPQVEDGAAGVTNSRSSSSKVVRSSIADRLAFFEQNKQKEGLSDTRRDSKLLQKSVSDEEKSKSLQRMEAGGVAHSPSSYKINSALSTFLNDTVSGDREDEPESEPTSTTHDSSDDEDDGDGSGTPMETSDTEHDDSMKNDSIDSEQAPPTLPKSQPPQHFDERRREESKKFKATAQLLLATPSDQQPDEEHNLARVQSPNKLKAELKINLSSAIAVAQAGTDDKSNNNDHNVRPPINAITETETATTTTTTETTTTTATKAAHSKVEILVPETDASQQATHESEGEVHLGLSQINDNHYVTKDRSAVAATRATGTDAEAETAGPTAAEAAVGTDRTSIQTESQSRTLGKTMEVESRTQTIEAKEGLTRPDVDVEVTQRLSVVRARLQQFEVVGSADKEKSSDDSPTDNNLNSKAHTDSNVLPPTIDNNSTNSHLAFGSPERGPTIFPEEREEEGKEEEKSSLDQHVGEAKAKAETMETEIETETVQKCPSIGEEEEQVPLEIQTKDRETLEVKSEVDVVRAEAKEGDANTASNNAVAPRTPSKIPIDEYPEDLNPFKSDDDDNGDDDYDDKEMNKENVRGGLAGAERRSTTPKPAVNLNPFDSSDDEIELEKCQRSPASATATATTTTMTTPKIPPPRPPPPRISRNPFGEEDEEQSAPSFARRSSLTSSLSKKTPVPTPRTNLSQSLNPTPEPTPRLSTKTTPATSHILQNSSEYYGSTNSLGTASAQSLHRNSDVRASNNSLASSAGGTMRSRKSRRAPAPPAPVKELFPSTETVNSSKTSTPSSSTMGTPKASRKKRPAPAPPKPARLEPATVPEIKVEPNEAEPKNSFSYPLQSELDSKLSDEEKALLEGKTLPPPPSSDPLPTEGTESETTLLGAGRQGSKRLIPLNADLLEEHGVVAAEGGGCQSDDLKERQQRQQAGGLQEEETNVVYRRVLIPPSDIDTPTQEDDHLDEELNAGTASTACHDRQLEKMKDNKEAKNRNRQSQISATSSGGEDSDPTTPFNKSAHGKWKRRKGPAPALPIPPRKVLQMLPLQEIRHELDIIEVQQQGLEKQGVILEKMIRDRCEGKNGEQLNTGGDGPAETTAAAGEVVQNSKEVEYLILQLFELVNEKNELFRRQAELMYLRRQHRLEQEQADLEYEIRVLMAQPERNKTDTDKAREEALIERLVEVVQLRNEVVECLEKDRLREAEEDLSIKQRLESHIARRGDELDVGQKSSAKLSKKEKKKQKESKKLSKNKKMDADKDADESELSGDKQKLKKKKKIFLF